MELQEARVHPQRKIPHDTRRETVIEMLEHPDRSRKAMAESAGISRTRLYQYLNDAQAHPLQKLGEAEKELAYRRRAAELLGHAVPEPDEAPAATSCAASLVDDGMNVVAANAALGRPLTYGEHCEVLRRLWPERYPNLNPRFGWYQAALGTMSVQTLSQFGFAITSIVVNKRTRVGLGDVLRGPGETAPREPRLGRGAARRSSTSGCRHRRRRTPDREEHKTMANANDIDHGDLVRAIKPIMEDAAKSRGVISYSALAEKAKEDKLATAAWQGLHGHDPRLWNALYEITMDAYHEHGFFLSVVVVGKHELAPRGKGIHDIIAAHTPDMVWEHHLGAAHEHYRPRFKRCRAS